MTRLVVLGPPSFPALDLLRASRVDYVASEELATLRDSVSGTDAILITPRYARLLGELLPFATRLRWIHALAAGVDQLPFDALRTISVTVTNSRGLYADALGEFAIAAMLWFAKDLRRLERNHAAHRWEPFTVARLEGKTAGIVGFGGIGRAVGRRAEAMGMRVLPVRSREGSIDEVIAASDYIVLSTPLTAATRGLLNAARIASMRSTAVLVNVSRGAVVDQRALVEALRERRIRGAALDVFETEPLPPDHPLWTLDNVLISPHSADHTDDAHERAIRFFLSNLSRFERGETLENIVDLTAGY
ncbi:MAG TPA: D-2-hydroxyacid dehydrogenase [Thermoanaerobaculia bacterium]